MEDVFRGENCEIQKNGEQFIKVVEYDTDEGGGTIYFPLENLERGMNKQKQLY